MGRAEAAQHPWGSCAAAGAKGAVLGSAGGGWGSAGRGRGVSGIQCFAGRDSMDSHCFLKLWPVNGSAVTAEMHPLQGQPGVQ